MSRKGTFRDLSIPTVTRILRTFRPALSGEAPRLAAVLLLSVLVTILELAKPWPIKLVFDRVLIPHGGAPGLFGLSPEATLIACAGSLVLISITLGVVSRGAMVAAARVGRKATTRIRGQVFDHLHRLAFPFHQSSRTGDLLVRLMSDVNTVRDVLFASWINLAGRGFTVAGIVIVMFALDPVLALLALCPLPFLLLELGRSSGRMRQATRNQRRREGEAASFAAETLRQIRVVKAYAAERRAGVRFATDSTSGERAGLRAVKIAARMGQTTELLSGVGLALVLFVGANAVVGGRLSAGELLVFLSYARLLYKPIREVSKEGARLSKAAASAERLMEVLAIPPEDPGKIGRLAPPFRGDLELRDVRFTYQDGIEALRGLSARIGKGTLAVVAGPNGSGKSTVLALLVRLVTPEEGEILVDGHPIVEFQLESYRERLAYVPQDIQLFGASVRENILYGRPDATQDEVEKATREALFAEVVERLPGGYEAVLGEGGSTISGGEARRLMLARAALRDADILLLDEPLSGLDPEARAVAAAAIRRIASGRTTLVVSHGPAEELDPDLVLRLEEGRLAGTETPWVRRNRVPAGRAAGES